MNVQSKKNEHANALVYIYLKRFRLILSDICLPAVALLFTTELIVSLDSP